MEAVTTTTWTAHYNNSSTSFIPASDHYVGPSRLATAIGVSFMLVFFVQGLLGNLWILLAVLSRRHVWNIINLFIASLCFNELLTDALIVVLIIDSYIWRAWTAGELLCKLNPEFSVAFTGCSLWHTAFIAIHRYIVVVHNDAYKRMSKRAYVTFVLVVARLIPFACTFPGFNLQTSGYVPKLLRCILLPNQGARIVSITMVQIIAPCVIVVLCYALVFAYVLRKARHVADSNIILQREIQITKMFGVIFLMILFGFIPYAVVRNVDKGNQLNADVYVVVSVFYGIATCSSPLIYGVMSTEIRRVCMSCLEQMCIFTRIVRCMPCFKLPQNNHMLSMSQIAEYEPSPDRKSSYVQVQDATTQIENSSAVGEINYKSGGRTDEATSDQESQTVGCHHNNGPPHGLSSADQKYSRPKSDVCTTTVDERHQNFDSNDRAVASETDTLITNGNRDRSTQNLNQANSTSNQ